MYNVHMQVLQADYDFQSFFLSTLCVCVFVCLFVCLFVCVARQYKEAGRVSNELKQLKAELEPQSKQVSQ